MARTRKKSRRKNGFTLPLAVVAGVAPGVIGPIQHAMWHGPMGGVKELGRIWTGYDFTDGTFDIWRLKYGLLPAVMGGLAHWLIGSKLGINRMLGRARIPVIRI